MTKSPHFTTRRGFVASLGFGGVSLYGLWVAYGAAPGPLALFAPHAAEAAAAGAHGGGGGVGAEADVVNDFRRLHGEFIDRFTVPGGVVAPRALPSILLAGDTHDDHHAEPETMAMPDSGAHDMAAMNMAPQAAQAEPAGHGEAVAEPAPTLASTDHGTDAAPHASDVVANDAAHGSAPAAPIDVYLLAERWYFEPAHLRLETGVSYRFRMLAADIPHGASIELGRGSRMARLRPGAVTEMEMRFDRPGDHLVYCSLYCGQGHDLMQARIEVV